MRSTGMNRLKGLVLIWVGLFTVQAQAAEINNVSGNSPSEIDLNYLLSVKLDDLATLKTIVQKTKAHRPPTDEATLVRLAKIYFHYAWQIKPRREALSTARACQNLLQPTVDSGHAELAGTYLWYALCHGLRAARGDLFAGMAAGDVMMKNLYKAQEIDPDIENGAIQLTLGSLYFHLPTMMGGDRTRARELLENVVQRFPHNVMAWVCLGDFYRDLGEIDHARELYQAALRLDPGPHMAINKRLADERAQEGLNQVESLMQRRSPSGV